AGYIQHRLAVAGHTPPQNIFDAAAIDAVFQHSAGIPRLINQICDNAMLAAYAQSTRQIDAEQVSTTVKQMLPLRETPQSSPPLLRDSTQPLLAASYGPPPDLIARIATIEQRLSSLANDQAAQQRVDAGLLTDIRRQFDRFQSETREVVAGLTDQAKSEIAAAQQDQSGRIEQRFAAMASSQSLQDQANAADLAELRRQFERFQAESRESIACLIEQARSDLASGQQERVIRLEQRLTAVTNNQAMQDRAAGAELADLRRQFERFQTEARETITFLAEQTKTDLATAQQERIARVEQRLAAMSSTQTTQGRADAALLADLRRQFDRLQSEARATLINLSDQAKSELTASQQESRRLLTEVRRENATVRDQFKELYDQLQQQSEAYSYRSAALTERQKEDLEASRQSLTEFSEQIRQRINGFDEKIQQIDSIVAQQAAPLAEERERWAAEFRAALAAAEDIRNRSEETARNRGEEIDAMRDEARTLLASTREQAASFLAALRAQATSAADEAQSEWLKVLEKGRLEAAELESRITEARKAMVAIESQALGLASLKESAAPQLEALRAEFPRLIEEGRTVWQKAIQDAQARTAALEDRIADAANAARRAEEQFTMQVNALKVEFATYTGQAGTAQEETQHQADLVRVELEERIGQQKRLLEESVAQLNRMQEEALAKWRSDADESARLLLQAQARAAEAADQTALRFDLSHEQYSALEAQCTTLLKNLTSSTDEVYEKLDTATERARNAAYGVKSLVDQTIDSANARVVEVQTAADKYTVRLADQLAQVVRHARGALAESEQASQTLYSARDRALAELRSGFEQMMERLDHHGIDLAQILEEIRSAAEKGGDEIRREAESAAAQSRDLRSRNESVIAEIASIESRILEVQSQLSAASEEATRAARSASELQTTSQARADELLSLVRQARIDAEAAMKLPREVTQAAAEKAVALGDLSQKMILVLKRLSAAEARAAREHIALEAASTSANETLDQLRSHTVRVGQLVGIIRQLYGTMDARVEHIRERLDSAEVLCKDVPREIQSLRQAFAPKITSDPDIRVSRIPGPPNQIPRSPDVAPLPLAKGSLGEIAQRNQKLGAWLREIVSDSDISLVTVDEKESHAADRLSAPAVTSSPPSHMAQ
ncbi:MAG TPA: hypothetical protein VMV81_12020, partial [Phycisphaerae bacterium]|nr:hypothetical protein [Phycisphaerae bacterium]